ncbi:MAG: hypothetical protein CMLOHMNK_02049 [Steroidobacteraceae bacterium]|nr:hypothetical protein [Steroidobacteraceae bacterium]
MSRSSGNAVRPCLEAALADLRRREADTQAEGHPAVHAYDPVVVSVVDTDACVVALETTHGVQAVTARHDRPDWAGAVFSGWLGVDHDGVLSVSQACFYAQPLRQRVTISAE